MSERDLREPEWSERERDRVEAMQPVRSPDPDMLTDSMAEFYRLRAEAQSVKIVKLEGMADDAIRLAEMVAELDFDGHIHYTWSICRHCTAKRLAFALLQWRRECSPSTLS